MQVHLLPRVCGWGVSAIEPFGISGGRAACSLWRRFSEICAPSLPVGTRQTQETGSVWNYLALLRQMEVRLAKAKLQCCDRAGKDLKIENLPF